MKEVLHYANRVAQNIADFWLNSTALGFITKFIVSGWLLFIGVHVYFYYVIALMFIDVFTGIWASRVAGDAFQSKKLRKGLLEKFALYVILIISVFILELILKKILSYNEFYGVALLAIFISTYEISSIIEKVLIINPNLTFLNKVARILNLLDNRLEKKAEKTIDKILELDEKDTDSSGFDKRK